VIDESDLEVNLRTAHAPCGMHVKAGSYVELHHVPTGVRVAVSTDTRQRIDRQLAEIALEAILNCWDARAGRLVAEQGTP
jgi:protein subunit release factor A